jgi:hypothetical protein
MKYQFTVVWAYLLMAVGLGLILAGLAFGILLGTLGQKGLLGFKPVDDVVVRVTAALLIVVAGLLVGGPILVAGQLLRLFVDQRRLLVQINRRLSRWDSRIASRSVEDDPEGPTFGERFGRR